LLTNHPADDINALVEHRFYQVLASKEKMLDKTLTYQDCLFRWHRVGKISFKKHFSAEIFYTEIWNYRIINNNLYIGKVQ
jgi:hypothetical protein